MVPVNPALQLQVKVLLPSVHVPPFRQGLGVQSSTLVWQVVPVKPALHMQVKPAIPSTHTPPFRHGLAAQSSMLVSQLRPVKPFLHVQTYVPAVVPFVDQAD